MFYVLYREKKYKVASSIIINETLQIGNREPHSIRNNNNNNINNSNDISEKDRDALKLNKDIENNTTCCPKTPRTSLIHLRPKQQCLGLFNQQHT